MQNGRDHVKNARGKDVLLYEQGLDAPLNLAPPGEKEHMVMQQLQNVNLKYHNEERQDEMARKSVPHNGTNQNNDRVNNAAIQDINDATTKISDINLKKMTVGNDTRLFESRHDQANDRHRVDDLRKQEHNEHVKPLNNRTENVAGVKSMKPPSNQQIGHHAKLNPDKGHPIEDVLGDTIKGIHDMGNELVRNGHIEDDLNQPKEVKQSVLFTGRQLLTLYDAFYTWFREGYIKSHHNATDTFANHPALLDVKFHSTDDLGIILAEALAERFYLTSETFPHSYGPCAPLIYCLGHQACLFRFSNEFCLTDPLPGTRKVLQLKVRCQRDEVYHSLYRTFRKSLDILQERTYPYIIDSLESQLSHSIRTFDRGDLLMDRHQDVGRSLSYRTSTIEDLRSWPEEVMYVKYKSRMEQGIRAYANTSLLPIAIPEYGVFDLSCPMPEHATQMGWVYVLILE